jgi:uncharacterized membrane protein
MIRVPEEVVPANRYMAWRRYLGLRRNVNKEALVVRLNVIVLQ